MSRPSAGMAAGVSLPNSVASPPLLCHRLCFHFPHNPPAFSHHRGRGTPSRWQGPAQRCLGPIALFPLPVKFLPETSIHHLGANHISLPFSQKSGSLFFSSTFHGGKMSRMRAHNPIGVGLGRIISSPGRRARRKSKAAVPPTTWSAFTETVGNYSATAGLFTSPQARHCPVPRSRRPSAGRSVGGPKLCVLFTLNPHHRQASRPPFRVNSGGFAIHPIGKRPNLWDGGITASRQKGGGAGPAVSPNTIAGDNYGQFEGLYTRGPCRP